MRMRLIRVTYLGLGLALATMLLWAGGAFRAQQAGAEDLRILALVLNKFSPRTGYTVVAPISTLSEGLDDPGTADWLKKTFAAKLNRKDPVVEALVDQLIERNRRPLRLGLQPTPADAYVVDDGRYARFLAQNGGGWSRLYAEYPDVRGMTELSLPAYDEDSGMALVYMGKNWGPAEGGGGLILFRYASTRMVVISSISLWVS